MNWKENIRRWRQLSDEEKRRIRIRNIPRKVANSMAFAGEPVDIEISERELTTLLTGKDSSSIHFNTPPRN